MTNLLEFLSEIPLFFGNGLIKYFVNINFWQENPLIISYPVLCHVNWSVRSKKGNTFVSSHCTCTNTMNDDKYSSQMGLLLTGRHACEFYRIGSSYCLSALKWGPVCRVVVLSGPRLVRPPLTSAGIPQSREQSRKAVASFPTINTYIFSNMETGFEKLFVKRGHPSDNVIDGELINVVTCCNKNPMAELFNIFSFF